MKFSSLTHTPDGVTIIGNNPEGGVSYVLHLSWDELWELAVKRGEKLTRKELEDRSRRTYGDLFDEEGGAAGA